MHRSANPVPAEVGVQAEAGCAGDLTDGGRDIAEAGSGPGGRNADVQRVLADASFREKFLAANSFEPITGGPEQFARMIDQEAAKWGKVIRDAKMTVD